ncbi:TetR/AcrR family transcriptional regulator [Fodinicola feengrottensis]|uniref:TetR/AcrR family transcriptional regulator n=1 Tax=Fodinicola feengrottensis TaxID=435914 RepID=A0ABP4T0M1_9ACTN
MTVRRRGAALEDSILEAAWTELMSVGYARLTMEGVAARAQTGKQVLYRRWRNRAELVITAVRHHIGSVADQIPDTGELRSDVLAVLQRMTQRQRDLGPEILHGLMAEAPDLAPEFLTVIDGVMTTLLEQAEKRGELKVTDLPVRVVTLPADLLRHEMLLTRHPIAENTLVDIVDQVFLPLVRASISSKVSD